MDDLDDVMQPNCDVCGTVMYVIDGGYRCRGCGFKIDIPWVERPTRGDDLPGIAGGRRE